LQPEEIRREVGERWSRVCTAANPTTYNIVAFGDQVSRAAEAEVWKSSPEVGHERLDIVVSTTGLVQRILQEHIRGCKLVNDTEVALGTPETGEPSTYDGFVLLFFRHKVLLLQRLLAKASMALASASRKLFGCRRDNTLYLAFKSN
jgi:hypothetical protein